MKNTRLWSILTYLVGWPLSFLALFFMVKIVISHKEPLLNIHSLNIELFVYGIICFLLYFLVRGLVWHTILSQKNKELALKDTLYLWSTAELRRFIPGNIWSLFTKTHVFSQKNIEKKDVVISFFKEAQVIIAATLFLSMFSSYFIADILIPYMPHKEIITTSILLFIAIVILYFLKKSKENRIIFLFATLSFFLYGFGTYLTMLSFLPLPISLSFVFTSYFIFSLLVGYVSIITPSGLGMREGVIILGLSQFIGIQLASLGAIVARIVIIISELLFVLIIFLWRNIIGGYLKKIERFFTTYIFEIILFLCILVYCIYFTHAAFARHNNFYTGRFDLGNMDQTVWNTLQGNIFQFTNPDNTHTISRLAFHADFILIALSPLYLIWSDPKNLLFIQTLVLALGSLFVYTLSQKILKNKPTSLILSASFLLNPAVQHTNLYDFHATTLATTFILAAFYFFVSQKNLLSILFFIIAASTKEQIWFITFLIGMYAFLRKIFFEKKYKDAYIWGTFSLLSIGIFYYLLWIAIPKSRGGVHFAISYYSDFGDQPHSIAKNIFASPYKIFKTIFQYNKLLYMRQLLQPLLFLPLLSFTVIFSFPDLLINLLSNNTNLHQIYYQYSATITPFLFIATIFSLHYIQRVFKNVSIIYISLVLLGSTFFSVYDYGPLPFSKSPNIDMFVKPQKNAKEIEAVLKKIPVEKSVSASNNLGAHLSQRREIYTIPLGLENADYIAILLGDLFAQPSPMYQKQLVEKYKKNNTYQLLSEIGDFYLFKKRL